MRTKGPDLLYICSPRLNQLQILRALAEDPFLTQAVLARRCGLSVAMVNNYLKELCDAGLIEYRRKSIKSISYHLTDLGRAQVEILESELTWDEIERFAHAKERILKRILAQRPGTFPRRVILYGSGNLAELVFHALAQSEVRVIGVCDDDARIGSEWCGCQVLDALQIANTAPDAVIITDLRNTDAIWNRLKTLLNGGIQIIRLDGHPSHGLPVEAQQPEPHLMHPWA